MSPIKTVIIVGAGGNVGAPILSAVTAAGFDVTVLSRKSSKSTFGNHKVISISDDYPHGELVAAFKGQDAVISTITTLSTGGQELLIDAAIEAGVRRFIPSEFGGDNRHEETVKLASVFKSKRAIIDYLKARQDKIEWTAIPTGAFYDWCFKVHFTGFDIPNRKATLYEGGTNKFSSTPLPLVGEWVATILKHADDTANEYVPVEAFEVSQLEILAALEKVTGEKFSIEHQTGQDLITGSQKKIEEGDVYGEFGLVQAILFVPGKGGSHHESAVSWMDKLGVKQLDLIEETEKALKTL